MTIWILAVLALWVGQTMLPPSARYLSAPGSRGSALLSALGPRDTPPPMPLIGERLERARLNLLEALPVFLGLALLIEAHSDGAPPPIASLGALVFLIARVLYVPAYLSGIPGLRSTIWVSSWVGLVLLLRALLSG